MHTTSIDISEQTRQAMCGLLQGVLADGIDLVSHLKQAHWTVRGPNFIGLHELLDDLHEKMEEKVDLTAERIAALGGQAEGTVDVAAGASRLPKYPLDAATRPPATSSPRSRAPPTRRCGSSRRTSQPAEIIGGQIFTKRQPQQDDNAKGAIVSILSAGVFACVLPRSQRAAPAVR
jgi:hypothetical protein